GGALPAKPIKAAGEGEEAGGPPLLLAETWDTAADLTGWWMSEKLDGVRAYWDGKQLISRLGNLFHAPDWFLDGLPAVPLDGELWIARKAFQRTVGIVRRQDKTELWKEVKYLVFDAPGVKDPFERRLEFLADTFGPKKLPHAAHHPHERCRGLEHLRAELARVEALGGEGLMLRQPGSAYETGRSSTLLKVKTFRDAEATVIGHQAGAGKHKGRLGALLVKLADGTEFAVGTGFTDKERSAPPLVGSVITFRYQELSDAGVPRFPSYVGARIDAKPAPLPTNPNPLPEARAAKANTPAPTKSGGPKRYFEFAEGMSSKFWEVSVSGKDVTTRWGRIGSEGQSKTKTFADPTKARAEADKLIEEKTEKGYVEK
ncbi:MAG TPA: DNA ligase, partial [Gemmataceae bacterium]|nr:DNA ligase [Gemmataceae bacterium]